MQIHSLPHYGGPADSRKGWGEPDGHGKRPHLALRNYVALLLLILIAFPIFLTWVGGPSRAWQRTVEKINAAREAQDDPEEKGMGIRF